MQVDINIDVFRKDRGQFRPYRAGKRGLGQACHPHRADLRQKDVALLVHKEHVIVASRAPDAHGDSVTGQNHVVVVHAVAVGGGEVAPEQIRPERLQSHRHIRAIGILGPCGQARHGLALAFLLLIAGALTVLMGFPLIAARQIGRGAG